MSENKALADQPMAEPPPVAQTYEAPASASSDGGNNNQKTPQQEARRPSIQVLVAAVEHSSRCKDECTLYYCSMMKKVVLHVKTCTTGSRNCKVCMRMLKFCCYHAKRCPDRICPIPFCSKLKNNVRQLRMFEFRHVRTWA